MGQDKVGEKQSNLPEKKFRAGQIAATIWKNEMKDKQGNQVIYKTVSVGKQYKDKDGHWRNSNSLKMNDIPKVILVLNKAYEHLALAENDDVEIEIQ